jgi:hypothetical protein
MELLFKHLAWTHIPKPHHQVVTGGGQDTAIRAKGSLIHLFDMAKRLRNHFAGLRIPKPDRIVEACRSDDSAGGAEVDTV